MSTIDGHVRSPDGTRLAFQLRGAGPAILLLAGQANNHTWWNRSREDFHNTRATITMDYRGTGASDKPDRAYSTLGFAEDAITVLDHLEIDRADIYGTSMGGRVAQWIAARHPQRVRRLVLGCTSPGGTLGIERGNEVRRALNRPDSAETLADLMYTPAWRETHPGPYTTLGDPDMPAHARRWHLRASNEHDTCAVLPQIAAPTLVLHGDQDLLAPPGNAAVLAAHIPGARTHIFPGARHGYFDECRPATSAVVSEFLAR
ncbi:alpha/beta fold hydrolase [Amycolatopsis palatopharyngis]|uniref:alpha/beta fold hydrolase n=1 Tax=Amycolatopsis palatopharyngis TaxID=187982 RepID=UPI000E2737BD|nr:alpha/beta fold hydrolase [Amycolatopsis palatopharyngis]